MGPVRAVHWEVSDRFGTYGETRVQLRDDGLDSGD